MKPLVTTIRVMSCLRTRDMQLCHICACFNDVADATMTDFSDEIIVQIQVL